MAPEIEYLQFPCQILNTPAEEVIDLSSSEVQDIIRHMREVAGAQDGSGMDRRKMVGVAAPQLGYPVRIVLVDVEATEQGPSKHCEVFINPLVTVRTNVVTTWWEGCFSVKGRRALVPRRCLVGLQAFTPEGEWVEREFDGYRARIVLHETDHLEGRGYPSHLTSQSVFRVAPELDAVFKDVKDDSERLDNWPALTTAEFEQLKHNTTPWK